MQYEVTIGIPVYNARQYVRQTLDCVLAQTLDSIEILVLDDCSTDDSMDIVREYQQTRPRGKDIRIVSQEFNKGIGAARNRILSEAKGRYLYFMDADDLITPTTVSLLLKTAKEHKAEVVMASHERIELYHQEPQKTKCQYTFKVFEDNTTFARYAFGHYGALNANIWNVLMDLRFLRDSHLQFVNTNFWEDMVFKYELVTYVNRAVLLSDITYYYMCRENSLSNFQERKEISKSEMLHNAATIDTLKYDVNRILDKPYFPDWLTFVLDTDFYIICEILRKRDIVHPIITDKELRNILYSPLSVMQTLRHGGLKSCLYKLLSVLPAPLSVKLIYLMGKTRKLI